ncbi:MAG: RidA family protein, partial [Rhizobiales bacterium]|nr:RidA family protein [Hyphomicrobiales bacterium]
DQSKLITMTKYLNQTFKGWLPAQTLVPVPRLAIDGMLFEVDAVVDLANKK